MKASYEIGDFQQRNQKSLPKSQRWNEVDEGSDSMK